MRAEPMMLQSGSMHLLYVFFQSNSKPPAAIKIVCMRQIEQKNAAFSDAFPLYAMYARSVLSIAITISAELPEYLTKLRTLRLGTAQRWRLLHMNCEMIFLPAK